MILYTLSYVEIYGLVVMVEKKKPDWMAGKINLPGGKVERGENPAQTANRELLEETGMESYDAQWCGEIMDTNEEWKIDVFRHRAHGFPETKTNEPVRLYDCNNLPPNIMPNLRYLIPLLRDRYVFEVLDYGTYMRLSYNGVILGRAV